MEYLTFGMHGSARNSYEYQNAPGSSNKNSLQYNLSPGLKSDILHGKTDHTGRNLPLQRISVAVTLNYNTIFNL